jgi:hypothetical protein
VAVNSGAAFVWGQVDIRRPWPAFGGRCAAIATRLVAWLARSDERRDELGRICCWRAGIRWDALLAKIRDQPYRTPEGEGVSYPLPRCEPVVIRFRPRVRVMSRPMSRAENGPDGSAYFRTRRPAAERPHLGDAVEPKRTSGRSEQ